MISTVSVTGAWEFKGSSSRGYGRLAIIPVVGA